MTVTLGTPGLLIGSMFRALGLALWYIFKSEPQPTKPNSPLEARLKKLQSELEDNWRWGILGKEAEQSFAIVLSRYYAITAEIRKDPSLGDHLIFIAELGERAVQAGERLYQFKGSMDKTLYAQSYQSLLGQLQGLIEHLNQIQVALVNQDQEALGAMLQALDSLPAHSFPDRMR